MPRANRHFLPGHVLHQLGVGHPAPGARLDHEDLEAALEQFREIAIDLGREANDVEKT